MLKHHLWIKLLLLFLCGIVFPFLLLTVFANTVILRQSRETESQRIYNNMHIVSVTVDSTLRSAQYTLSPVWVNTEMKRALRNLEPVDKRSNIEDYLVCKRILDILADCASHNTMLLSLDMYSVNARTLFTTGADITQSSINNDYSLLNSSWYTAYRNSRTLDNWTALCFTYRDEPQLIKFYPVKTNHGTVLSEVYGISVSQQTIKSCIPTDMFSMNGGLLILDGMGNNLLSLGKLTPEDYKTASSEHSASNPLQTVICNGIPYYVYTIQSDWSKLQYIYLVPTSEVDGSRLTSALYTVIIFGAVLTILLFAVVVTIRYAVMPISHLFRAMKEVEKGNFSVRLPENRTDEVGMISRNFNHMTIKLKKLIDENYTMKLFKKDLELKFILSQINEHFLYNTLDSLHWSARKHNNPEIDSVISKLSCFYRNTLSSGQDIVSVKTVGDIIESYLYIQKFRMQERLCYTIDIDPQILKYRVLKYLFQPIVENAVVHGVSKKASGGTIQISLTQIGSHIRFCVKDTGPGISHDDLTQILSEVYRNENTSNRYFALKNVNAQLSHYYGDTYYINIESTPGTGTTVWFDVPIQE